MELAMHELPLTLFSSLAPLGAGAFFMIVAVVYWIVAMAGDLKNGSARKAFAMVTGILGLISPLMVFVVAGVVLAFVAIFLARMCFYALQIGVGL